MPVILALHHQSLLKLGTGYDSHDTSGLYDFERADRRVSHGVFRTGGDIPLGRRRRGQQLEFRGKLESGRVRTGERK
jgi:hypothetical protein